MGTCNWERDGDDVYCVVPTEYEDIKRYETAAWYDTYKIQPGRYKVKPTTIDYKPVDPAERRPYYGIVYKDAICVEHHAPSLFAGVPTGGGSIHEPEHTKTVYQETWYWFQIEQNLAEDSPVTE